MGEVSRSTEAATGSTVLVSRLDCTRNCPRSKSNSTLWETCYAIRVLYQSTVAFQLPLHFVLRREGLGTCEVQAGLLVVVEPRKEYDVP